jgi:hypothetical protein
VSDRRPDYLFVPSFVRFREFPGSKCGFTYRPSRSRRSDPVASLLFGRVQRELS